jgi:hypothetical protein
MSSAAQGGGKAIRHKRRAYVIIRNCKFTACPAISVRDGDFSLPLPDNGFQCAGPYFRSGVARTGVY